MNESGLLPAAWMLLLKPLWHINNCVAGTFPMLWNCQPCRVKMCFGFWSNLSPHEQNESNPPAQLPGGCSTATCSKRLQEPWAMGKYIHLTKPLQHYTLIKVQMQIHTWFISIQSIYRNKNIADKYANMGPHWFWNVNLMNLSSAIVAKPKNKMPTKLPHVPLLFLPDEWNRVSNISTLHNIVYIYIL